MCDAILKTPHLSFQKEGMWCKTFQLLLRIIGGVDYKVKISIFALISFFLGFFKLDSNHDACIAEDRVCRSLSALNFLLCLLKTRQDKRATAVEGNPKAPFSLASTVTYGINRNSRQGGAPLLSRCVHNLSPVILVLILPTTNGWKAE